MSAIAYDSRRVVKGSVFVALRGLKADGTTFASQAAARGAALVVAEQPPAEGVTTPWLVVTDARLALALLADAFYDHPSRRLQVVGVTGTNGKTTTAYLLAAILDAAGRKAGLLGTVTYRLGDEEREASRTTPEAPDVQQLLAEMIPRRLHVGRDGSVVACARVEARRRDALCRRDLHQSDARSPGLP